MPKYLKQKVNTVVKCPYNHQECITINCMAWMVAIDDGKNKINATCSVFPKEKWVKK